MSEEKSEILILEDYSNWRNLIADMLTARGYEVRVADNLDMAITALSGTPADLLIVDPRLNDPDEKDFSGLDIIKWAYGHTPSARFIIMSAYANESFLREYIGDQVAFSFFDKNRFDQEGFIKTVRQLTGHPSKSRDLHIGNGVIQADSDVVSLVSKQALIVEDAENWSDYYRTRLKELGLRPDAAKDYGEAVYYVRRNDYALAVVDLQLASSIEYNLDGLLLLDLLMFHGMPVIVVTDYLVPTLVDEIYSEYGSEVLTTLSKSNFNRQLFSDCVNQALLRAKPERENLEGRDKRRQKFEKMVEEFWQSKKRTPEAEAMVREHKENLSKMLRAHHALDRLRRCSFSIFIEEDRYGSKLYGSGFFISRDGYALTAYHNIPARLREEKKGYVKVFYRDMRKPLELSWFEELSHEEDDIALLLLPDAHGVTLDFIACAYLPLDIPDEERLRFWSNREVFVFGFPIQGQGSVEHLIEGKLPERQPFGDIVDDYDSEGTPRRLVPRIFIEGDRTRNIRGISGGPVYDIETGWVIAVQNRVAPEADKVFASELARTVVNCKWPRDLMSQVRVLRQRED
jgi:ActR/RegA family two-component response regulator